MNKSEFEFDLDFSKGDRLLIKTGGKLRYDRVLENGKRDTAQPIVDVAETSRSYVPRDGKNWEFMMEHRYRLYHQAGENAKKQPRETKKTNL